MKKTIIAISLFLSFNLFAESKILFIDANNNPTETKVAREFAKTSGQELIVYPSNGNKIDQKELNQLFDKHNFTSVHFSGHSGGLIFYGKNGAIALEDFVQEIKDKPSVKNIQSLYLLGCNSGNKSKILFWKEALPNLKFIAGFDGTAPVGTNPNGLIYYADILKNEDKILSSSNANDIKKSLAQIKKINDFPTSLLIKCNEQNDYLFQPKTILGDSFMRFSVKECADLLSKYRKNYEEPIRALITGKTDPKKESAQKLKEYYEATRQKEHCENDKVKSLEANKVLFLRFISEFDTNFSTYYQKMLSDLTEQLKKISSNIPEHIAKQLEIRKALLKKLNTDPKFMDEVLATNLKNLEEKIEKLKQVPFLKKCINAIENKKNLSEGELENSCRGRNAEEAIAMSKASNTMSLKDKAMKENAPARIKEHVENEIFFLEEKSSDLQNKLNNHILLLEKVKSNPKEITRSDIKNLEDVDILFLTGVNPEAVDQFQQIFVPYASLSASVFPYSWYDKPHGESIEAPRNQIDIDTAAFSKATEYNLDKIIYRAL